MVEITDSDIAVIAKEGESAIKINSIQVGAMSIIDCVIEERGSKANEIGCGRAHPTQRAIGINDRRREAAALPAEQDVVIAQSGAASMLQECRIFISAWIFEAGGRDCGAILLRRTVQKAVSQCDGIGVSIVKSVDWQNDLPS